MMGLLKVRTCQLCFLFIEIWKCYAMTTSGMRTAGGLFAADACEENLLPEPLSCQAALLPSFGDIDEQQEVEVELTCSWSHEYPVENVMFKYGFDDIEPELELGREMTVITRKVLQASEEDLRVIGFFCEFSFLHPLCGQITERSPCSIARANVRSDPLITEVGLGGTAHISCRRRKNDNMTQEQSDISWETKRISQNTFFTLTNSSRRSVSGDGTFVTLSSMRGGDNLTLVRCDVEGDSVNKNYGLSQIRVVEGITTIPSSSNPTTSLSSTISTTSPTTSVLEPTTASVLDTTTPTMGHITLLVTNPSTNTFIFDNIYFLISIVLAPVVMFLGICMIIILVRQKRKKVSAEPRPMPAMSHAVNDNTYEYEANDDALEHEYFQSCHCMADDSTSQHSEYVNDRMLQGGRPARTQRMPRSRSDSRLSHMAEMIPLKEIPKSQSAWALPGLSAEQSVLDLPMPAIPSRKRSMTANAAMRPPLPRSKPPQRQSEPREYAMIDESVLSRSMDATDTQPYACIQLHPRSQTLDPKVFIPKRKQKK